MSYVQNQDLVAGEFEDFCAATDFDGERESCSLQGVKGCKRMICCCTVSRGGTYLTKINFLKFCRQFHMVIYVSLQNQYPFLANREF